MRKLICFSKFIQTIIQNYQKEIPFKAFQFSTSYTKKNKFYQPSNVAVHFQGQIEVCIIKNSDRCQHPEDTVKACISQESALLLCVTHQWINLASGSYKILYPKSYMLYVFSSLCFSSLFYLLVTFSIYIYPCLKRISLVQ